MSRLVKLIPNFYRDSVALMQLAAQMERLAGVERAAAVMATRSNLDLLESIGLVDAGQTPHPDSVLIAMEGEDDAIEAALLSAEQNLRQAAESSTAAPGARGMAPTSLQMAMEDMPDANLALVSTPDEYAAAEAEKALRLGMNVMVFSSGMDLADEVRLKTLAGKQQRLMMGPDCGTAIIDGIPLGFANALQRGPVGVVASAGTGAQEISVVMDRAAVGVSQIVGCGARDLGDEIGAATMLQGLAALAGDASTRVIVLVAKHPSIAPARRVLAAAKRLDRPVVVNFLGLPLEDSAGGNLHVAETLEDAGRFAAALAAGQPLPPALAALPTSLARLARDGAARLSRRQRYVRGLFSGGTFCYEAQMLIERELGPVWSNAPLDPAYELPDAWQSREHTVLDLGDAAFTHGRPHPMIDLRLRLDRMDEEMMDPETAVILMDLVLGYGAHPDPAPEIAQALADARRFSTGARPEAVVVMSVCGTAGDPQDLKAQTEALRRSDVLVAPSNAAAARLAAAIVRRRHLVGEAI